MRHALLLVFLAGCGTPGIHASGEHSLASRLLVVPLASQTHAGNGGLACLLLLLRYRGMDLDLEAEERFPAETLDSVSPGELRDYLRGRGFLAEVLRGELSHELPRGLLGWLERGHPVLLELEGRFVLASGFDPVARWVRVEDARGPPREIAFAELERLLGVMLVAVPRGTR